MINPKQPHESQQLANIRLDENKIKKNISSLNKKVTSHLYVKADENNVEKKELKNKRRINKQMNFPFIKLLKMFAGADCNLGKLNNNLNQSVREKARNAAKPSFSTEEKDRSMHFNPVGLEGMRKLLPDSHITEVEMKILVNDGRKIAEELVKNEKGEQNQLEPSKENAQKLVWFIMYMAASQGEEHHSGTLRIDDPKGSVADFLNACGAYGRISSHYKGYKVGQRGVDFDSEIKLPASKHSVLFSRLPGSNATTFVKLEEFGCPPFWKKKFRNKENFNEFLGHSMNYVKGITGVKSSFSVKLEPRRENINKSDIKLFKEAMANLRKIEGNNSVYSKENEVFGLEHGISKMVEILKKKIDMLSKEELNEVDEANLKLAIDQLRKLMKKIEKDKANGYMGERQGDEVCLLSLEKFLEKEKGIILPSE